MFNLFFISFNSEADIQECIYSFQKVKKSEVFVYDSGSTDSTVTISKTILGDAKVFCAENNLGYAHAVNQVMNKATSDIVVVANADVKIDIKDTSKLLDAIETMRKRPSIAVGCLRQRYFDSTPQRSVRVAPSILENVLNFCGSSKLIDRRFLNVRTRVSISSKYYLDGAFLILNRKIFEKLGGFDEEFPFYGEEVDYCLRAINSGFELNLFGYGEVYHRRGGSSKELNEKKIYLAIQARLRFVKKHFHRPARVLYCLSLWLEILQKLIIFRLLSWVLPELDGKFQANLIRQKVLYHWLKGRRIDYL